jgi:hypothetical protein
MSTRLFVWMLPAALGLASGCVGNVGAPLGGGTDSHPLPGGGGGGGTVPASGGSSIPGGAGCQEAAPAVTAVRRLTRDEYASSLRGLLGDAQRATAIPFPKDGTGDDVLADPRTLIVSPSWAANAMDAAESAAKIAVANLSSLLPCNPAGAEQSCARQLATTLGKRAFRRPLASSVVVGILYVYSFVVQ